MTTGNSSNSRSDFIPEQSASTLTYGRGGGCFVSRGKAALLAAAVVAAVVLAAAFGRYVWAPAPPPVVHVPSVTMTTGAADSGEGDRRLPQDVQSVRYQLHLWPVLDHAPENKTAFTFEGRLALTVKVEADDGADRISLHAASTLTVQEKDIVLVEWSHETEVVGAYWELFPPRIYPKSMDGVFKTIPVSVTRTPALDLLDVHPERRLAQGERYVVFIRFNGTLGDSLTGLYRSSYTDDLTQQKRWLAVTHMQPTYAREAFPCMDEPSFRARFRLTIACRDGTSAIANAPLLQYTPIAGAPGWTWHQFEESVPMPTYLVAFAITDFKCIYPTKRSANPLSGLNRLNVTSAQGIKTQINDLDDLQKLSLLLLQLQARTARKSIEETEEVEVRLCARPSVLQNGRFAVDITPKLLDYFGDYFGVAYPLPKMDLLAIPDFDMGAMENWGLIIFREFHLLVDEEADGVAAVELVAETVAHELAHQWLGNLVTPEWWNELWLNEGFAVYVQSAAVDFVQPTWKTQARFQTSVLQSSLLDDSSEATRAIAASVHSKDDITQAFDAIAYKKGACLLRMLHHSLGDAAFRLGVASYMRTWQHNSTTESRLWEPLTDAVEATPSADTDHQRLPDNATVAEVMASWTRVEGYPVVNVTLDRTTGKITFTQELFLARAWRRHCCRKYSSPQLWYVPLSFATRSAAARNASVLEDTRPRVWLVNRTLDVQLESPPGPDDWLVVNLHQTGYFRVNYDLDNWRLLTAQLRANHTALPAGVRAQLLSDALSLASAGQLPYAVALNLTLYLPRRELDPLPWSAALSALGVMSKALSGQPELVIFERYMQRLLNPTWSRVAPSDPATVAEPSISTTSMEALSHEALLHRAEVVSWACEVHLDKCEDWAYRAVHLWRLQPETRNSVPVLLRPTAYCSAVATGSPDVWDFMWRQYLAVRASPGQQAIILQALACTSDPARAASLLAKALDDADIRQQDVGLVWQAAASEPVASLVEFRYLREHWPDIYNKFGASSLVSTSVLSAATLSLTTESDLQDLKVFRAEHNDTLGAVSRSLALGEENLKTEIEWRRKYFPDVRKWMEAALQNPHVFN